MSWGRNARAHDPLSMQGHPAMEFAVRSTFSVSAIVAVSLILTVQVAAATHRGAVIGPDAPAPSQSFGMSGISAVPSPSTTGMGGGLNQPGAPNSSTPGIIGTGAAPSGLPGDSPTAPGFPGKVGQ